MPKDKHGQEFGVGSLVRFPHGIARVQGFFEGNAETTLEDAKAIARKVSTCRDPKPYFAHEVELLERPSLLTRLSQKLFG